MAPRVILTSSETKGSPVSNLPTCAKRRSITPQLTHLSGSACVALQQQGANTLDLTRYIGSLVFSPPGDVPNAVFFNVGRFNVVKYPISWALPIALVAGAVLAAAGWRQRTWLQILSSAAITVVMLIGSAVVGFGIWNVLAGLRSTMGVVESYLYLAGLLILVAGISIAVAQLIRRKIGALAAATGVVTVWWALGLLTSMYAPGMSYLFVWPALVGGVILLWRVSPIANRQWQPILSVPVVGTALILLVPAIDTFYQLAQPRPGNPDSELLYIIAIPVMLLAFVVELFRVFWVCPTQTAADRASL